MRFGKLCSFLYNTYSHSPSREILHSQLNFAQFVRRGSGGREAPCNLNIIEYCAEGTADQTDLIGGGVPSEGTAFETPT